MVFKEMVSIETESPLFTVEIKSSQPTTQTVSRTTCIFIIYSVFSTWNQSPQHTFETTLLFNDIIRSAIRMETIAFSSKLCSKFGSQLY